MIGSLILGACAHTPPLPQDMQPTEAARAEKAARNLPNVVLTEQMLYEILLGDIAVQRGRPDLGAQVYLDMARTTRDPRIAAHAASLAFESRQTDKTLEAFTLWQELSINCSPT